MGSTQRSCQQTGAKVNPKVKLAERGQCLGFQVNIIHARLRWNRNYSNANTARKCWEGLVGTIGIVYYRPKDIPILLYTELFHNSESASVEAISLK